MEVRVENSDMRALSLSLKTRRLVPLRDAARGIVSDLIRKHEGNVKAMADDLGVDRKGLTKAILGDPELEHLRVSVFAGRGKPPAGALAPVVVTATDLRRHGGNVKALAAELGVTHKRLTRAIADRPDLARLQRELATDRPRVAKDRPRAGVLP